jgi:hypothetical protein
MSRNSKSPGSFESYFKDILKNEINDWFTESEKETFEKNYNEKYHKFYKAHIENYFRKNDIIDDWNKLANRNDNDKLAEEEDFKIIVKENIELFFDNPPVKLQDPIRHKGQNKSEIDEKYINDKKELFKETTRKYFLSKSGFLSRIFGKRKTKSKTGGTKKNRK